MPLNQVIVADESSGDALGSCEDICEDKGFGFIKPDNDSDEVYAHRKINGDGTHRIAYLTEGDEVT